MPELPEVEILVRRLGPLLKNKTVRAVEVRRARVIAPATAPQLRRALAGATFKSLIRRGKYLLFTLRPARGSEPLQLLGHLGMTGRMYLAPAGNVPPRHAAVILSLGRNNLIYEDTRYFGRFTLDTSALTRLGPEPLGPDFTANGLDSALRNSKQAIKVKLLDQSLLAGVGNIYASEALFRARIPPRLPAYKLTHAQASRLWEAIRQVLEDAIKAGSTLPLDFAGKGGRDGLFYYGTAGSESEFYQERLLVYDRAGQPCAECGTAIRRLVQAARSTFFCPACQRR